MPLASCGTLSEMQNLGCAKDLMNQNLRCNKMPREFRYGTFKCEKPVFHRTYFLPRPQPVQPPQLLRGSTPLADKQPQSKWTWPLDPLSFATRLLGVIVVLAALAMTFKIITT